MRASRKGKPAEVGHTIQHPGEKGQPAGCRWAQQVSEAHGLHGGQSSWTQIGSAAEESDRIGAEEAQQAVQYHASRHGKG